MIFRKFPAVIFCLLVLFSSCGKNSILGLDVLPSTDDVGAIFTDTFSLVTTTVRDDSVLSSSTLNNVAGNMFDPIFGKTYAAFFTELLLPTNEVNFGTPDTLFIDSIVLTLAYNGYYGYVNVPQTFNVYRVTEVMHPAPADGYYSGKSFAVDPEVLGRKQNLVPDFVDSLHALNLTLPPHLRIRLSDRFGQEILDQSGSAALTNDSAFKDFLRGICVAPDTAATPYGASILYFDLFSLLSGIHLYWHTPHLDSLSYVIPITTSEVRNNYFKHNYSGTVVQQHLQNQSGTGDSIVYVQGLAGLKTKIVMPALSSLKNVLINKAELVITQVNDPEETDSVFTSPLQMVCVTQDTSGKDIAIPDNFLFFPSFGGTRIDKVTIDRQPFAEYRFSVADQLQQIVNGSQNDLGLFLIAYKRAELANRLSAGGNLRVDNLKMKLNLIYTPIP